MNLIVETNFVLEMALLQEEHEACERVVIMAEQGRLRLVIPAYSLVEPHETVVRRQRARKALYRNLNIELKQLGRSGHIRNQVAEAEKLAKVLTRSAQVESENLRSVRGRLTACATVVPLNRAVLTHGAALEQRHGLSPQDAIVFASVLEALKSEPGEACFVTRNSKDFADPDIKQELAEHQCKLMTRFDRAAAFISSRLPPPPAERDVT